MITKPRKEQIQIQTAAAINGSGKWMIQFGRDYTREEKEYAVHVGGEFKLRISEKGDAVEVPAGMKKW